MSSFDEDQAEAVARHRDGVLDLIATVVLRCGGPPQGTIVGVMFAGDEDLADHHGLEIMDVPGAAGVDDLGEVYQMGDQFLPRLRRAVGISRAERVALVTFGLSEEAARVLTGNVAVSLQLPAQRVAVTGEGWLDLDDEEVFGDLDEIIQSRAATSAVLAGLRFPAGELER